MADTFKNQEKRNLKILILLLIILFGIYLSYEFRDKDLSFFTYLTLTPILLLIVLFTINYRRARNLWIHYTHKSFVAKNIPAIIKEYKDKNSEDRIFTFVKEIYKSIYTLPRERNLELKMMGRIFKYSEKGYKKNEN